MRVFVTGGSGFVGRNLLVALQERGDTARALARSDVAAATVHNVGAEPVRGDLTAHDALRDGMAGCEVVFHIAASLTTGGTLAAQRAVNVDGARTMLDAARAAGVSRFVYYSAASVIIDGHPIHDADETQPIPNPPIGPYSQSKAEAEAIVRAANTPDFRTVAIRPPLIWGGREDGVIPQLVQLVRRGQFRWFDHGEYHYATCHVDNVTEGALLAAEQGRGGEAYFLTDSTATTFRAFVTDVLATQGLTPGEGNVPWGGAMAFATFLEGAWRFLRRPGAPPLTREIVALLGPFALNDAKARRELGYTAHRDRSDGMAVLASASAPHDRAV